MKQFSEVISSVVFPVFLLVVLASNPALAEESKDKLQRVETLMKISGTNHLIAGTSNGIRGFFTRLKHPRLRKGFESTTNAVAVFDAKNMQRRLAADLSKRLGEREIEAAISFYRSDLGRQVVELERRSRSPESGATGGKSIAEIRREMEADTERAQLINGLVKDLRLADISRSIRKSSVYAFTPGLFASGESKKTLSKAELRTLAHKRAAPFLRASERNIPFVAFHTYRSVSTDGLRKYRAFLTSPAGRRYYKRYMRSFEDLLAEETEDFTSLIMEAFAKT
ncbi:MAG: DUF2059 domain-containing protein [Pseudomonadota bacterium]